MARSAQTKRIALEIQAFTAKTLQRLAFEVQANLTAEPPKGGTPVQTGWARANWVQSVGTPAAVVANPVTVDERIAALPSGLAAQAAGVAAVAGYSKIGPSVFQTNNVPYIKELNEGTSQQAPRAFVQTAVTKAVRTVAKGSR